MAKKKVYRKKKGRRVRKMKMSRAILEGFPKSKLCKLRYVETISLDPSAGAIVQKIYRANGAYDPNYSGAGHSPMGYDQWAQIYLNYCVVGSQINMRYIPNTNASTTPGYFGILLDSTTAGSNEYAYTDYLLESKLTGKNAKVAGGLQMNDAKGYYPSVSKSFSAKKFFGVQNIQDGKEYSAAVDNTPANTAYYCCWLGALNGSQDPGLTFFQITIDYIVLFKDPQVLPVSGTIGAGQEPDRPGPTGAGQGGAPN